LEFDGHGDSTWFLSDGVKVCGRTARAVITDDRVISVGDAQFEGMLGKTWRFIDYF